MDLTFHEQFLRQDKRTEYETIDSQMIKSFLKVCILLSALQLSCLPVLAYQSKDIAKKTGDNSASFTLQYQRWGYFGFYHVGIKVSMKTSNPAQKNSTLTTWYINGSGDTSFVLDTIFTYQIPAIFPVFMRGYIHPEHPTAVVLNIRKWENVGEEIPISQDVASRIVAFAQNGMTSIKSNKYMYSPVINPFSIGALDFYTSNSFVASIIHWLNEGREHVSLPNDGYYVGFGGPYLPRTVFEAN